jgi:hypothetical protein
MSVVMIVILLVVIGIQVGLGFWASSIAKKKDQSPGVFFAAGLFLGVIGVIIAAVAPAGQPGARR